MTVNYRIEVKLLFQNHISKILIRVSIMVKNHIRGFNIIIYNP